MTDSDTIALLRAANARLEAANADLSARLDELRRLFDVDTVQLAPLSNEDYRRILNQMKMRPAPDEPPLEGC